MTGQVIYTTAAVMRAVLANSRLLRRLYYRLTASIAYQPLRLDRTLLDAAVATNRASLARVERWIDEATLAGSVFNYGMPGHIQAHIDDPIGDRPTYTDALVCLATQIGRGLRYLELGPSVGKTLFQISQAVRGAQLCAVDIEDINPTLASFFAPVSVDTWPLAQSQMRDMLGRDSRYVDTQRDNNLRYLAGDLFDSSTWDRLDGLTFNLVFSDAFHSGDALLTEWHNLRDRSLLSPDGFVMVWDDLTSPAMRRAFDRIAAEMKEIFGPGRVKASIELFDGWVGKMERPHPIGFVRFKP